MLSLMLPQILSMGALNNWFQEISSLFFCIICQSYHYIEYTFYDFWFNGRDFNILFCKTRDRETTTRTTHFQVIKAHQTVLNFKTLGEMRM